MDMIIIEFRSKEHARYAPLVSPTRARACQMIHSCRFAMCHHDIPCTTLIVLIVRSPSLLYRFDIVLLSFFVGELAHLALLERDDRPLRVRYSPSTSSADEDLCLELTAQ